MSPPSGALLSRGDEPPGTPRAFVAPARRVLRADSTGSLPPCGWHRPAAHPNVPPQFRRRENHLYVLPLCRSLRAEPVEATASGPFRQAQGAVSTLKRLLEAQDANDRGRHRFGARGQGEAHSGAAVSLIEVRAWGERDTMLLEQCLAPRFGVGVWT